MQTVKRSEIILKSKPFAYVLCNSERRLRCDACLRRNDDVKCCTRCSFMYYCNKACQRRDWENHKEECMNMKRIAPHVPSDFTRLMARVILKLKKPNSKKTEFIIDDLSRTFDDLMSHSREILKDKERTEQFSVFSEVLKDFIGMDTLPPMKELLEIFGKLVINTFSITNEDMQNIGNGLYLGASILNHSCCPNAVFVFEGPNVSVHSITEIPEFHISKVFISYIDILATREERRKLLMEQYYFHCHCEYCSNEQLDLEMRSLQCPNMECKNFRHLLEGEVKCMDCEEQISEKRKMLNTFQSFNEPLNSLRELKKKQNYQQLYDEANKILIDMKIFHELNIYRIQCQDLAFDACIELQRWEEAIQHGCSTLNGYRKYYGLCHPNLGVQLMKLGKILNYEGKSNKALALLLEAEAIIKVTHSTNHPLYETLIQIMDTCRPID